MRPGLHGYYACPCPSLDLVFHQCARAKLRTRLHLGRKSAGQHRDAQDSLVAAAMLDRLLGVFREGPEHPLSRHDNRSAD